MEAAHFSKEFRASEHYPIGNALTDRLLVTRPRLRKFLQDIAPNMPKAKSQHPAICWPIDVTQS
jgi:hypothetical protein